MVPLDHAADVGYTLEADSLEQLFGLTLEGLLEVALGQTPEHASGVHRVHLQEPTLEHLLVAWVDELIFLLRKQELIPLDAEIDLAERPAAWELRATISTAQLDPASHPWRRDIKAASFPGLAIEAEPGGWWTRIALEV